ncbi:MAG: diacylglycerol O-acyltransferase [Acidimicrobiales bacterium]|nr:diacylglycerol O-acyltransferase [Acidimicrobiales bacterium]
MAPMPLTDAMFLLAETREHPMHVGGLQVFTAPEGAGPDHLREMHAAVLEHTDVSPMFRRRAQRSLASLGQWAWVEDRNIDLEYHVRHSALPRPGRIRELLALTSRLHGTLLDRNRPLWEAHLIEGLEGGRFAVYTKIHHAMFDGVAALRLLGRALSEDPDVRDAPPPWALPSRRRRGSADGGGGGAADALAAPLHVAASAARAATEMVGVGQALVAMVQEARHDHAASLPFQAPRTMLNVPITGARRFAAQSWSLDRVKAVGTDAGATLNDVVLAMSAGALRAYLSEEGELPDQPLIAMVPVALRKAEDSDSGGNAVGTILCNLGTHVDDPLDRLDLIQTSMRHGKEALAGLSPLQITALSAVAMAPMALGPLYRFEGVMRPPFNVVISNIPGPRRPLYWNGARLDGVYPLSIPTDGQAFNITVTSYHEHLEFGLTGCRRRVPHLQRMLIHLESALADLEKAVG